MTAVTEVPGVLAPPASAHRVTAVLVAHDGERWLPRVLAAVESQTRAPDRLIAVDTGSQDGSRALVAQAWGDQAIVDADRKLGFGAAIEVGLHARAATPPEVVDLAAAEHTDWLWLLHDDSAPAADALELLLEAASQSEAVGIVGPKLVDWDDPDVLLEVGLTVGRAGRRDTGLDGLERDQGQHDHRTDVLAVPSAGMLVRRSVWDRLRGFDPSLPLLRDDIDLCWRTHLAGHRVVLVPQARVADAQATSRGLRAPHAISGNIARVDRQHGFQVALARAGWGLPLVFGWLVLVSLAKSVGHLLTRSPRPAATELAALTAATATPWRWLRSRWRARGRRAVRRSRLTGLFTARFVVIRQAIEVIGGWAAGELPPVVLADHSSPARRLSESADLAEPGPVADESLTAASSPPGWRLLRQPLAWTFVVLAGLTAWAWRSVDFAALSPADSAAVLWREALSGVHGPGLGTDAPPSPAALARAAWATVLPWVSPQVILVLAPLLAGMVAYFAGRVATRSRWLRSWAALVWGGSPVLAAATGAGRIGPVLAAIALPALAALLFQALRAGRSRKLCLTALLTAALTTAVPLVGALVVAASVLILLFGRGWTRLRAALLAALPLGLLGPWLGHLINQPLAVLAGPGALDQPQGLRRVGQLVVPSAWAQLTVGSGWWVCGGLVVAVFALGALLRGGARGRTAVGLLAVATLGLAYAVVAPNWSLGPGVTPWVGIGGFLGLLAVLAAILTAFDGLPSRLARAARLRIGWRVVIGPMVVLALAGPVAAGIGQGGRGHRLVPPPRLPAVAADAAASPAGTRTLVLEQDDIGLSYRLDGGEPQPLAADLPAAGLSESADPQLRAAVTALVNPQTTLTPAMTALQPFAVGWVLVRRPESVDLANDLDQTPGLIRAGQSSAGQLWRAISSGPDAARARITDPVGRTITQVPVVGPHSAIDTWLEPGPAGRTLVLAEARSSRWQAWVDGQPRPAGPGNGWQQTFTLPASGGRVIVTTDDPVAERWRWGQAGLAVLLLLGAVFAPGRAHRRQNRPEA